MRLFIVTNILRLFAWIPLRVNHALGNFVGSILYLANSRERRTTERNLALCFPDKSVAERRHIAKRSLQETCKWGFEIGAIWIRGYSWCSSKVLNIKNEQLFTDALADERGILLIAPHFGNWELAGMCAGAKGKCTVIYSPPKLEELDPLVRAGRSGSTIVPANTRGVIAILKALKKGEMTGILPDQVPTEGGGGIYSDFFGIPAYTQTLIYNLIQKTNPIVLQIYALRCEGGFELGFMEPDSAIYDADQQTSVDGLNRTIEQLCELDHAQYQWEYKRFKHQADGRDLYR